MRSGAEYKAALADDRAVYVDGQRVEDVRTHPAFAGVVDTVASLYDRALELPEVMAYESPELGTTINRVFSIPRTREDLAARRAASQAWAQVSQGFVGRGPDHVGAFLTAFAAAPQVFDRGERKFSGNVERYYREVAERDLFVTYAIIPPQVNRAAAATEWDDELLQVGVLEEREDGIVVRGSQMLATSGPIADEVFVSCIRPLSPEEERYAISFALPTATEGMKLYCRRPYAPSKPSVFDYPLSTRFDEPDALVVFEDVFVPWERVFVHRDVPGVRAQFFETPAHVLGNAQAQIRLIVKTKFLAGVTRKIATMTGIERIPSVQEKLGELASLASIVEGMSIASEATSVQHPSGVEIPNPRFLYGAMGLQAELYPRILGLLRELAGGGVLQQPSSYRELVEPETRRDMERYLQASGTEAEERVKLFKLAWDAVGSEFGSRHHQYELFYAGAPFVVKGYAFRNYGYEEALEQVDAFLEGYGLDVAALPGGAAA